MKILSKRELRKRNTKKRKKLERKLERDKKRKEKEEYKLFIKSIKERDNYTCQICNTYYGKDALPQSLQAMHILSKENYPELKMDSNNVLSGCFSCHKTGKVSSHHDGFAFTIFFMRKFPERYKYLIEKLSSSF